MIDKEKMRQHFSQRLHAALTAKGIRQRGRGADIIDRLKENGVSKTAQAVSKWLNGGAVPELDSLTVIANWLGVRREWLEHGVQPMYESGSRSNAVPDPSASNVTDNFHHMGKVPLISWVQAGMWCETVCSLESCDAELWLPCPVKISSTGYALRVVGDSMTNPGLGRSYPDGCVIFVDPEIVTNNGDRVIARLPASNEATFKVLVTDAGKNYLKPINPQYPIIEITEEMQICGKVVGSFIPD